MRPVSVKFNSKFDRLTGEKNDGFRDLLSSETKIVSTDSIKN